MATKTFTFPASQVYVDATGIEHTVTTGEAFRLDMTDLGTTSSFTVLNASALITCTDGFTFGLDADPLYMFWCTADGTATDEEGCLQFVEDGGSKIVLDITSLDIDDADDPSTATMIFEHRNNTALTFTWDTLTVA